MRNTHIQPTKIEFLINVFMITKKELVQIEDFLIANPDILEALIISGPVASICGINIYTMINLFSDLKNAGIKINSRVSNHMRRTIQRIRKESQNQRETSMNIIVNFD